jgi:hypothetical protein
MNFLKKFLLAIIILFVKNIYAANFTVDSGGKRITDYNNAVGSDADIDTIIFDSGNGILEANVNNSLLLSIEANGSNNGSIDFNTASITLDVSNNIADQDQRLSQIISNSSDFTINASNLYSNQLIINNNTVISGSSILNFNNILLNSDANLSLSNQINISGNINLGATNGDIHGSNTSLTFNGTTSQIVNSTIGTTSAIANINIANSILNEIDFNKNITVGNINFNNSAQAIFDISGSSKTLNLSGNITNSGSSDAFITNSADDGVFLISGSSDQNINAKIGTSILRLKQIDIQNGSNQITFSQDSYIDILNIKAGHNNSNVNNSNIMDISTANIDEDAIFSGSIAKNIGDLNISGTKSLTLQHNINISGNIIGQSASTETIIGNLGEINFSGSSSQSVTDVILGGSAENSKRLASITNSNSNDITLNDNIFVTNIILNSDGNLNLAAAATMDIEGDIIRSSGSGIISGGGDVILSGSAAQNINVDIGQSGSRIDNLEISNSIGAILNNDIYATSFNYSGNNLTLISNSNLDIAGDMDLSNKNVNFRLSSDNSASNPFGRINIGTNNLILNKSTIFFDYDSLTGNALNFNYNGGSYNIINNGNITNLNNISVTDNSYLFNHSLNLDGSNIKTTINKDSNIFNEERLGDINIEMLDHALSKSNIASDILSITNEDELENAMESIRLPNNAPLLKYNISTHNNLNHFTTQRIRNITLFPKRNRQGLWAEFYSSNIVQDEDKKKGHDGFVVGGTGFLAGYDYVNAGNVIGLSGFYSGAKVENDNKGDFISVIESSGFTLYNKFGSKYNKGFYNINNFHYISNDYSNERKVKLPNIDEIIKAELSGSSMSFRSEIGYNINFIKSSIFTPKISLEYFADERDSYEEKGSENSAFKVKEEEYDNFIFSAGFDFGGKFYTRKKTLFSPILDISWRKYLGDDQQKRIISYNNNEYFSINSAELPSDYLNIAFNAEYSRAVDDFHINPVFNIKYNAMLTEEFISHAFTAEIRYNFNLRLMGTKRK